VGIVEVRDALARAREAGLDLVEVAPAAKPPVCRIMDYGKWKYAQRKKEQKSKSKRHEMSLKEIRIKTPKIGAHDLEIKISHARDFLQRGDRVQFTLRFRGRELAHIEQGERVFQQVQALLGDVSKIEQPPHREGRRLTMALTPSGKKAQKPASGERADAEAPSPPAPAPAPSVEAAPPSGQAC